MVALLPRRRPFFWRRERKKNEKRCRFGRQQNFPGAPFPLSLFSKKNKKVASPSSFLLFSPFFCFLGASLHFLPARIRQR